MRVELTEAREGFRKSYKVGDVIDLPDEEAIRLINSGQAVPVRSQPVERTVRRRGPGRPRKSVAATG